MDTIPENLLDIFFTVTPAALDKINNFLKMREAKPIGIKISTSVINREGGYIFDDSLKFVDETSADDIKLEIEGINFFTTKETMNFLDNAVLDFITVGESSGFAIHRPSGCSAGGCKNCSSGCCS